MPEPTKEEAEEIFNMDISDWQWQSYLTLRKEFAPDPAPSSEGQS